MRRYGVLGRYIPEFGRVIGQMQHDLFHIYTVDAHTMMVIRNMRRLHYRSSQETFPVAYHCIKSLPKIELLYIAGLFHDIAKGRGGDHSTLGAQDVIAFCRRHQTDRRGYRTGRVAGARASADVGHRTEQRHQRSGRDPRIRKRSAHRSAAGLSLHADGCRHQRDQSESLERLAGNADAPAVHGNAQGTAPRPQSSSRSRRVHRTPQNRSVGEACRAWHRSRTSAALWDDPDPEFFLQHSVESDRVVDRSDRASTTSRPAHWYWCATSSATPAKKARRRSFCTRATSRDCLPRA